ncbi:SigB/SigF/SigG family RNA polymerase sigma factor [Nocardiopsis sp. HNM0947]|uniref:SigB/SigF/SigG family RNA polymerase sigma factor n=1 Tax=Nocardiopsis coralli TaxID=2772213 RepID=A0ABR9PA09_9ACTN|nr:SigB/SigF/SigG family RNA polymerase sigma factor [Nocardiopsis coralli]MBE3000675.1 SigB/SigF/SigG family RNA polymerase sigma factor [Nocardiopsis coralli]
MSATDRGDHREDGEAEDLLLELRDLPIQDETSWRLRDRLVRLYRPTVAREASRFRNRGVDHEELCQVAYLGLMKAISGFDPSYNKRFLSYLLPTVSGEIKRHFRDSVWAVHAPRSVRDRRAELNRFVGEFTRIHARAPRQSEIGAHFGLDSQATGELLNASESYSAASIDTPRSMDGEGAEEPLSNGLGSIDHELDSVVDKQALRASLAELSERQQRVVVLSFFSEMAQTQIAEQLGCSQMQVSRVLRGTLDQLRSQLLGEGEEE